MNSYKVLNKQIYTEGDYKFVPFRFEDRLDIMKWRNEQIYHLRQSKPLTVEDQDRYFNNVVSKLFDQQQPSQILFSFLKDDLCVGYGGLVHINWVDKNAEISFLMNTSLEKEHFHQFWTSYLSLIEEVAFVDLSFHKIYTYAYDLRPQLYDILETLGFNKEAVLKEHVLFHDRFIDVIIHSKYNTTFDLKLAGLDDLSITFEWATNPDIRRFSINRNSITWEEHQTWFESKINNPRCRFYIFTKNTEPVGSIRFDIDSYNNAQISYLIDPQYHGHKLGIELLRKGLNILNKDCEKVKSVYGYVLKDNIASIKTFQRLCFEEIKLENDLLKFVKELADENCR